MKIQIMVLWVVTMCSILVGYQCFRGPSSGCRITWRWRQHGPTKFWYLLHHNPEDHDLNVHFVNKWTIPTAVLTNKVSIYCKNENFSVAEYHPVQMYRTQDGKVWDVVPHHITTQCQNPEDHDPNEGKAYILDLSMWGGGSGQFHVLAAAPCKWTFSTHCREGRVGLKSQSEHVTNRRISAPVRNQTPSVHLTASHFTELSGPMH